ncbi:MAG: adenylyltransferase/cytidyltransferase family protein [Verrucomicrobiaceae bacterium]|nr:adenylyltransferase/cytidyltransferase family protein [Verrucomicrobiaceae bacterium]
MANDELLAEIKRKNASNGDVVFVSGNFNILHPGHLRLLQFARECGDFLVVGVNTNRMAAGAAILDETHRLESVKANNWVGHAFLLDMPAADFITLLKPHAVVKGKEHENRLNPEAAALASYGGALQFGSGETVFSAYELLRGELARQTDELPLDLPYDFPGRHGFTLGSLEDIVRSAGKVRIGVVGDVIVDEYVSCNPLGMSQEDPTIVVTPMGSDRFLGGAAIVAAHCAGLGAQVSYFTVTGEDALHGYIEQKLEEYNVSGHLIVDDTRPTTLKQRFRASGKTLLRVNHLRQHGIRRDLQQQLLAKILTVLDDLDVLVFSDFNYGCLPQTLVDEITTEARSHGVLLMADSQCSSQIGDVSRFKDVDLLTPTEMEARVSTRNHEDGLVILAEKVRHQARAQHILLKLGADGVLVHAADQTKGWLTDQLPAFNCQAKDTAGAGDSLLAATAVTIALGGSIWQAAFLGSLAAACQVSRVGNTPLTTAELLKALTA